MSTATATYTLAEAKECAVLALLHSAAHSEPDTYGCLDCIAALTSMCEPHSVKDAAAMRYTRAAVMASRANSEDEVRAAVAYALGDHGGTKND